MSANHEEVVNRINSSITSLKHELQAWERVTFNVKKDGSPFQNLNKCFNAAYYEFGGYDPTHEYPRLRVSYWCEGYQNREINCYHSKYGERNIPMTFEEIKAEIEKKIAYCKEQIQYGEDVLKHVDDDLKAIDDEIEKLKEIICARKEDTFHNYAYTLNEYLNANVGYLRL